MNDGFHPLWQDFLDGGLTPEGFAQLNEMLEADPALARLAAELYEEHRLLGLIGARDAEPEGRFVAAVERRLTAERAAFAGAIRDRLKSETGARPWWRDWRVTAGAALAAVVALAAIFFAVQARAPSGAAGSYVATLLATQDARWRQATGAIPNGTRLVPGPLQLQGGAAVVRFDGGASVVLSGPVALDLESRGTATLRRGTVTVRTPPEATGFTLRTPGSEVVDLGTEFAVKVDDQGATEVRVLEGEVEYRARGPRRQRPRVLMEGQAVRLAARTGETVLSPEGTARFGELVERLQRGHLSVQPVAYEGFRYPPGGLALAEAGGGHGWLGPWRLRTDAEMSDHADARMDFSITGRSLGWPGLPVEAGAVEFSGGDNYRLRALAQPIDLGRDGIFYVSMLVRYETAPAGRGERDATRLTFRAARDYWGPSIGFALRPTGQAQIGFGAGVVFNSSVRFPVEQTMLWVAKITASARHEDEISLRIYRAGEAVEAFEPLEWNVVTRGIDSSAVLDLLVVTAIGTTRRWIDEIRIGATWDAVTGTPPALADAASPPAKREGE